MYCVILLLLQSVQSAFDPSGSYPFHESANYIGIKVDPSSNEPTWDEAESYCLSKYGTSLATILTSDDQTEIENNIISESVNFYDGSTDNLWIGFRDYSTMKTWAPCDATNCFLESWDCNAKDEMLDTSWHSMESGGYDTNKCGVIRRVNAYFGRWRDELCTYKKDFICNKPGGKYDPIPFECDGETNDTSPAPTDLPTIVTKAPTKSPTFNPTKTPTKNPTVTPTFTPTFNHTVTPTKIPTKNPTVISTINPSKTPTVNPNLIPTQPPTSNPVVEITENQGIMSDRDNGNVGKAENEDVIGMVMNNAPLLYGIISALIVCIILIVGYYCMRQKKLKDRISELEQQKVPPVVVNSDNPFPNTMSSSSIFQYNGAGDGDKNPVFLDAKPTYIAGRNERNYQHGEGALPALQAVINVNENAYSTQYGNDDSSDSDDSNKNITVTAGNIDQDAIIVPPPLPPPIPPIPPSNTNNVDGNAYQYEYEQAQN